MSPLEFCEKSIEVLKPLEGLEWAEKWTALRRRFDYDYCQNMRRCSRDRGGIVKDRYGRPAFSLEGTTGTIVLSPRLGYFFEEVAHALRTGEKITPFPGKELDEYCVHFNEWLDGQIKV